ncbi:MAG: hypothetical protein KJZ84_23920 [Bryobacteraceae bacterium]|nr:hypothetical protein [Bryobacteraceae bacterium]
MANIVVIQGTDTPKDARAVINANFAALNAAAGGKHVENLNAATGTVTITHNLGTQDVVAQAWDSSGRAAIVDFALVDAASISASFLVPFTGRVVVRS